MRRSVIRIVIIASILAVFAILSGPASAAGQEGAAPAGTWSYTTEDGRAGSLHAGMVISNGTQTAAGGCIFNEWEVSFQTNTTGSYEGAVEGHVGANCTVHVDNVSLQRQEPPSRVQALMTKLGKILQRATGQSHSGFDRRAYTKAEINDPPGIDLLWARVIIEYIDDYSSLSGGDVAHKCDKAIHWDLSSCTSAHNDTSATRMWGWTRADGDGFAFQPTYAKAKVAVTPGAEPVHSCYFGTQYPLVNFRCRPTDP